MGKTKSKSVYTEEMKLLHKILLLLHISSPEVKCTLNMSYRNHRKERMKFQPPTLGTKRNAQKNASTIYSRPTNTQEAEGACDRVDPFQGHASVVGIFCNFVFLYPEAIPPPVTTKNSMFLLTKEE